MQVGGTNQSAQMQQQMQMRKMDGTGGGNGQGKGGGMGDVMQSLSTDDRTSLQDQMSSLSPEDRTAAIAQMKELDSTTMTSDDYMDTLISIIDDSTSTDSNTDGTSIEVYA